MNDFLLCFDVNDVMQIVDPKQNAHFANQISFYFEHQKKGIGKMMTYLT